MEIKSLVVGGEDVFVLTLNRAEFADIVHCMVEVDAMVPDNLTDEMEAALDASYGYGGW